MLYTDQLLIVKVSCKTIFHFWLNNVCCKKRGLGTMADCESQFSVIWGPNCFLIGPLTEDSPLSCCSFSSLSDSLELFKCVLKSIKGL